MSTDKSSSSGKGVGGMKNPNPPAVFDYMTGAGVFDSPKNGGGPKNEEIKKMLTIKTSL